MGFRRFGRCLGFEGRLRLLCLILHRQVLESRTIDLFYLGRSERAGCGCRLFRFDLAQPGYLLRRIFLPIVS